MILDRLRKKGLISPPSFVLSNCQFLTIIGSVAYGVADTAVKIKLSDNDVYGFCIPPKDYMFVQLRGEIPGFGTRGPSFDEYIKHGVVDPDGNGGTGQEWDFTIFNIIKYFDLCMDGNPNMIDTLFTREEHVLHCTTIGRMFRDNRKLFISKRIWNTFRGYSMGQMKKMTDRTAKGARVEIINKFGYDVKFAYNIIRGFDEVHQLMETGEMDIQRAKEVMKSIRRGEWKIEEVVDFAKKKCAELDVAYTNCKLPEHPPELEIKQLLIQCLEEHYGSLSSVIQQPNWSIEALTKIDMLLDQYRGRLAESSVRKKPWWKFW